MSSTHRRSSFWQTLSSTHHARETFGVEKHFLRYAQRVRRLSISASRTGTFQYGDRHRFVVETDVLALWAATPHIFPLLQGVEIGEQYPLQSPVYDVLLPGILAWHALRSLSLSIGITEVFPLFECTQVELIGACAAFHELVLHDHHTFQPLNPFESLMCFWDDDTVRNQLTSWTGSVLMHAVNVRKVHIELPIEYADLRTLSTVPMVVTLYVPHVVNVPSVLADLPVGAFSALRSLTLVDRTRRGTLAQNMVPCNLSSAFEQCTIRFHGHLLPLETVASLLAAVGQHETRMHISITLLSGELDIRNHSRGSETTVLLRALRPSRTMQSLVLDVVQGFSLKEDDMAQILELYPCLHTLRWSSYPDTCCWMSLERFMAMLKDRPHIRMLPVCIVSGDLPPTEVQVSFGTHGYSASIHILEDIYDEELCVTIGDFFPNVTEYVVNPSL
jgi:hypothetical protein